MLRAVLDTNVLVSGLIRPRGAVGRVIRGLRDGRFVAVVSPPILDEVVDVLSRPFLLEKYGLNEEAVATFLRLLVLRSELVRPEIEIRRCRDPADDMFLEAAATAAADRLVTGHEDLLEIGRYDETRIVTPGAFAAEIE